MTEKKTHKKHITINIDEEMYDEIERMAEDKEHSLSHTARKIIAESLRKQTKFQDEIVTK